MWTVRLADKPEKNTILWLKKYGSLFPRVPAASAGKAEAADWQEHGITFMNDSAQSDDGLVTG